MMMIFDEMRCRERIGSCSGKYFIIFGLRVFEASRARVQGMASSHIGGYAVEKTHREKSENRSSVARLGRKTRLVRIVIHLHEISVPFSSARLTWDVRFFSGYDIYSNRNLDFNIRIIFLTEPYFQKFYAI